MARMNVSLADSLVAELRRVVPHRQRSRFISEAVAARLDQMKQERAVRVAAGLWSADGRADPDAEIRTLRDAWTDRAARLDDRG